MQARDLMSRDVVRVSPETPLRDVARVLLHHQLSAVPVVDATGAVVGMVSEGDLIGRKKTERETRSEWWLMRLAEGEPVNEEFERHIQGPLAVASEVMSSPVISVTEDTPFDEIAALMATHRVKRVPVIRDGQLVGIVRRADLLRSVGGGPDAPVPRPPEPAPVATAEAKPEVGERADGHFAVDPTDDGLTVNDFKHLVANHKLDIELERARERRAQAEARRHEVARLISTHVSDNGWHGLVHRAREAAERGETEYLILRFPSRLCSDDGRAINAPDPEWPKTLRGEAAEMYLRWERELRPRGFRIAARVLDFPGGIPGDIGLYLEWGG